MTDVVAALAGGLGALARFEIGSRTPWGTWIVNLSGAVALGVLVGMDVDADVYRVAGTGFLGAFTTFSGWMVESHRLRAARALLNLAGMLAAGVLGAGAAQALAT